MIRRLVGDGCAVRVLDNLSTGDRRLLEGVRYEFVEGDIRDREGVDAAMAGVDAVVHLAAHTNVVDSIADPELDCDLNVRGTLTVLQSCVSQKVGRFVLASSSAPLGEQEPPVDEGRVPRPLSPYGASKLACEGYCSAFAGSYGLDTVVLRFSNAYGPYSSHKTSVVARFIRQILGDDELVIYGDGEQTRDFVNVRDLSAAIAGALVSDGVGGEVFQIGSGIETSVLELVAALERTTGRAIRVRHEPERTGEIRRSWVLIDKARRMLGYQPCVALGEGLKECWAYLKG